MICSVPSIPCLHYIKYSCSGARVFLAFCALSVAKGMAITMKNNSSHPLHTTEVNITFKDYKMFISKAQSNIRKICAVIAPPITLFLILYYFIAFPFQDLTVRIVMLLLIVFLILILIIRESEYKKEFKSNKLLNNNKIIFQFYDDRLEVLSFKNENEVLRHISYTHLYNIIKNKKHFYFMASKFTGTILPKRCCNIKLTEFLEELSEEIKNNNKG